jgi:hypothetical protein
MFMQNNKTQNYEIFRQFSVSKFAFVSNQYAVFLSDLNFDFTDSLIFDRDKVSRGCQLHRICIKKEHMLEWGLKN